MSTNSSVRNTLIDVDDSVLIVIDIQDHFLDKYDQAISQSLVARVEWLLQVASQLEVPVVAMAEDIQSSAGLNQNIAACLPAGTRVHDKNAFGLAANPEILAAVNQTGRRTALLVGMETDVCVAQSALGLLGEGFAVAVLEDAVATTEGGQETGLSRMRDAGVVVSSVKALYYEWLRSVSATRRLNERLPELETGLLPESLLL